MRPILKAPDADLPIKDDIVRDGDGGTTFIGDGGGGCITDEGGRD